MAIKNKIDLERTLRVMLLPAVKYVTNTGLYLGSWGCKYSPSTVKLEGISRLLWGLIPTNIMDNRIIQLLDTFVENTNPASEDYWGSISDNDQRIVEMAPIAILFCLRPDLYEHYSTKDKLQIESWLGQVNNVKVYPNNWQWFKVFVNLFLEKVESFYFNPFALKTGLTNIEEYALNDGWYCDGYWDNADDSARDYYTAWSMHFYSMLYCLIKPEDTVRCERFKLRSELFAHDFIHWFSPDGSAIPFGRSLTYKFAQVSFWSLYAVLKLNGIELGVVKGIIFRHLRWWFSKNIFDRDGILTLGYTYQNQLMAESYNSNASSYWALKTFFILMADDNFWDAPELPLPVVPSEKYIQNGLAFIGRHEDEVQLFTNGQGTDINIVHEENKYRKFVYSTSFGFNIPRGNFNIRQLAFDSCLAVSDGSGFKSRSTYIPLNESTKYLVSSWSPIQGVLIKTTILPLTPYHIRIHKIITSKPIEVMDCGFTTEIDSVFGTKDSLDIHSPRGLISSISSVIGDLKILLVKPEPNTNILYPNNTGIPVLSGNLDIGTHLLMSVVYGGPKVKIPIQIKHHNNSKKVDILTSNHSKLLYTVSITEDGDTEIESL